MKTRYLMHVWELLWGKQNMIWSQKSGFENFLWDHTHVSLEKAFSYPEPVAFSLCGVIGSKNSIWQIDNSTYLSVRPSIHPSIHSSIHLSIYSIQNSKNLVLHQNQFKYSDNKSSINSWSSTESMDILSGFKGRLDGDDNIVSIEFWYCVMFSMNTLNCQLQHYFLTCI